MYSLPMIATMLFSEVEIREMRRLMTRLGAGSTIVDFEEQIQLASVKSTARLWRQQGEIIGFAYLDDFSNLWFDADPDYEKLEELEDQMILWGEECQKERSMKTREGVTLDSTCNADNLHRIQVLERHGFHPEQVRTLHYSRHLFDPIGMWRLPEGFTIRASRGMDEIDALVELHRAAFGTENMTVELRTAMMNTPQYVPGLDLLAVAPDGSLAAFCVCGFEDPDRRIGFTDPIGTHPAYQRKGLARGLVSTGLKLLKASGAEIAKLGTSSENSAMQRLAEETGFRIAMEQLWFSKNLA